MIEAKLLFDVLFTHASKVNNPLEKLEMATGVVT